MPYINRQGLTNQVELWTDPCTSITITNAAADKAFTGTIAVPSSSVLRGSIASAYVDLFIPSVQNYNAAENYVESLQYLQVSNDAGVAYDNCTKIVSRFLDTAAGSWTQGWWLYGNIDVSTLFSKGDTLQFKWKDADAHLDGFYLWVPQIRLRIYQTLSGTA